MTSRTQKFDTMTNRSYIRHLADRSPLSCRHHWVIQPAEGPLSTGACQVCGAQREFKNYVESPGWDDYNLVARSALGSSMVVAQEVEGHVEFQGMWGDSA
jgi:hypothetical protein